MAGLMDGKKVVGWLVCYKGNFCGKCWNLYEGYNSVGYGTEQDVFLGGADEQFGSLQFFIVYDNRKNEFHLVLEEGSEPISVNGRCVKDLQRMEGITDIVFGIDEYVFVPFCGEKYKWN